MPSKSRAQARLMAAVAHNPKFAKKVGIPQSVGRDFNEADSGTGILKMAAGGMLPPSPQDMQSRLLQMAGNRVPRRLADGGKVGMTVKAAQAVSDALGHIGNRDVASALTTLRSSRDAMLHPDISAAAQQMYTPGGIGPASKALQDLVEAHKGSLMAGVMARGGRARR